MTYSVRRAPENTKEIRKAESLGKLLTEDMGINLEVVGFHLIRNLPAIVWHRLEVVSLTAEEEYDKMMTEMLGEDHANRFRR